MADHQEQQQHESGTMSSHSQQPELSFGLALTAREDSGGAAQEECKFDDVMALQEEAIQVRAHLASAV